MMAMSGVRSDVIPDWRNTSLSLMEPSKGADIKVSPGHYDLADCCSVDIKSMAQLPLGTANRLVCQEEEEFIYRQQFLGGEMFN